MIVYKSRNIEVYPEAAGTQAEVCKPPTAISHGYFVPQSSSYPNGSVVVDICNGGYTIAGDRDSLTCIIGHWQGTSPYCLQSKFALSRFVNFK